MPITDVTRYANKDEIKGSLPTIVGCVVHLEAIFGSDFFLGVLVRDGRVFLLALFRFQRVGEHPDLRASEHKSANMKTRQCINLRLKKWQ